MALDDEVPVQFHEPVWVRKSAQSEVVMRQ